MVAWKIEIFTTGSVPFDVRHHVEMLEGKIFTRSLSVDAVVHVQVCEIEIFIPRSNPFDVRSHLEA